ncbi:hypothetical protein CIK06_26135 [Plantactinospora sp. KBS50]|nr:hypothetical protein CIK06_26135 [Plantactinospora sp. KBS50]
MQPAPTFVEDASAGSRPRWRLWTALGVVAVLLFCLAPLGVLVAALFRQADGGAAGAVGRPAPSPRLGGSGTATGAWLRDRIAEQVDRQSTALLAGDEDGFLAVADPDGSAIDTLRHQFAALRALHVRVWQAEVAARPTPVEGKPREWRFAVTYRYCFETADCTPSQLDVGTRWADGGALPRLVAVDPPDPDTNGPRPWQVNDLVALAGPRTTVASTPALRGKLPDLLARAERAAAVADRYAVGGTPPDRYLIFYAGHAEWNRWYGGDLPEWTGGYAVPVGAGQHDVVLNADELADSQAELDPLLRHEMTHVASLADRKQVGTEDWWLVEGLAEQAAANGRRPRLSRDLDEVRRVVDGDWDGRLADLRPADDAADWRVVGGYGASYLAVHHLVERFGQQPVIEFFRLVLRDGRSLEQASRLAFGGAWRPLSQDCVEYVRQLAG